MMEERIFKKGEIIFSDSLGVCKVAEVSTLNGKSQSYQYYKLESVFDCNQFCYLPTVGHRMKLRELISVEEAQTTRNNSEFDKVDVLQKKEIEYVLSNR